MNEWVYELSSGYAGYRSRRTGEWIYASKYNEMIKKMSKFEKVTEVHIVAFEDASGARHDTKEKAEAANKLLKFERYFDMEICMGDLYDLSSSGLIEFLNEHKNAILELLLDKKPD
jgi:hypothetical protein